MSNIFLNPYLPNTTKEVGSLIENFFNGSISNFIGSDALNQSPSINVVENDDHYLLEVATPGLSKNDVELKLENGLLTVSAERKEEKENRAERFTRREFSYTSFQRTLKLPENICEEKISATSNNGVLTVTLPKKEVTETVKTIEIK